MSATSVDENDGMMLWLDLYPEESARISRIDHAFLSVLRFANVC